MELKAVQPNTHIWLIFIIFSFVTIKKLLSNGDLVEKTSFPFVQSKTVNHNKYTCLRSTLILTSDGSR